MGKWLSLTSARNWWLRHSFCRAGLRSASTDLGDGTVMHCWLPKTHRPQNPNLLLVHGIGANAMWQWTDFIAPLAPHFNLFVPDLLFFGDSFTSLPHRSEAFQAMSVARMMEAQGVRKWSVVGMSYGGFVAYSMAAQFPERVERLVLCCAGVSLEENDRKEGLVRPKTTQEAVSLLFPQEPHKARELLALCFHNPPPPLPSCFLKDFIQVMCTPHLQQRKELVEALHKDRKLSDLPRITHKNVLLIWGEYDQLFPLELAHRLKRHVGDHVQLAIIKNAGHAINAEAPKEMLEHMKSFLIDSSSNGHKAD